MLCISFPSNKLFMYLDNLIMRRTVVRSYIVHSLEMLSRQSYELLDISRKTI